MADAPSYIVLIGDLERSRELGDNERENAQKKLEEIIDELNELDHEFASPLTITLGDEFQAVYHKSDHLFSQLWRIQAALHPVMIRYGIGCGTLSTKVNPDQAIGMDGPAFHRARAALEYLKDEKGMFRLEGTLEEPLLALMNQSLNLISHEMRGWKQRRFDILWRHQTGQTHSEITDSLGISNAAFYKNIEAGALETIIGISNSIKKVLNKQLDQ